MPLDVSNILRVNPPSIPATGGIVRTSFEASTLGGQSRLRAEYSLGPGLPYRIVGSTTLEEGVSFDPQAFEKDLTLQATGSTSGIMGVDIIAQVSEVGVVGAPIMSLGRVAIQMAAPGPAMVVAPGGTGSLGDRLQAFRAARGLTQAQVADQADVARSTISRVESGSEPSDPIRERLEAFLRS